MRISLTEKKAEAIERMKLIKLSPKVIDEFDKAGIINYSKAEGALHSLHDHPEWIDYIKTFEKRFKALVYHAEFSRFEFGDCLSLFHISDYEEEWANDELGLENGYSLCFVWNINDPSRSDFSGIEFKPMNGSIKRTW